MNMDEKYRVAYNWENQPGVKVKDTCLKFLGKALTNASDDQAMKLRHSFRDKWKQWDGDFDLKTGRPV